MSDLSSAAYAKRNLPEDDDLKTEKNRLLQQGRSTKTDWEIGLRMQKIRWTGKVDEWSGC